MTILIAIMMFLHILALIFTALSTFVLFMQAKMKLNVHTIPLFGIMILFTIMTLILMVYHPITYIFIGMINGTLYLIYLMLTHEFEIPFSLKLFESFVVNLFWSETIIFSLFLYHIKDHIILPTNENSEP